MTTATKTLWKIDPMHSEIQFKVKHLVISTVAGSFDSYDGKIEVEGDDFENAKAIQHFNQLQILIRPKADGLESRIQFYEPDETYNLNQLRLLAGHERSVAPMTFRSEVLFYDVRLEKENTLQTPNLNGKTGLLYVFSGSLKIMNNNKTVEKGDSIVFKEEHLDLISKEDSDLAFFVLDESALYSRNGLFAK